jgi:ubiquinone/menaquinone biosynthesis C-methylase UbiE
MKYRVPSKGSYPRDYKYGMHYFSRIPPVRWHATKRLEIALEYSEGIHTGKTILEVGAGPGYLFPALTERANIIDLDLLDYHSNAAKAMTVKEGIADKVSFKKGDILSLPFEDESFDLVFCIGILEHVSPEVAVKELHRVLRNEGHLIAGYPVETFIRWMARPFLSFPFWLMGYPMDRQDFTKFPYTHKDARTAIKKWFWIERSGKTPYSALPDILSLYEIVRCKKRSKV